MLKRHEIQVLRRAEHTWREVASLSGVAEKTARRIAAENPVTSVDNGAERAYRHVGRPSKAEVYRAHEASAPACTAHSSRRRSPPGVRDAAIRRTAIPDLRSALARGRRIELTFVREPRCVTFQ